MQRCFLTLLLIIFTALPALGSPVPTSGPWGIDAAGFRNLSTALASSTTVGKLIVVSKPMTINNKTTDRDIKVVSPGSINVAGGKTFKVNGFFDAGGFTVFPGQGFIVINNAPAIKTAWFGDKADANTASAATNAAAVNKTLATAAASMVKRVIPNYGVHYLTGTVTYPGSYIDLGGESYTTSYDGRATDEAPVKYIFVGSPIDKGFDLGSYPATVHNALRNVLVDGNGVVNKGVFSAGQHNIECVYVTKTLTDGIRLGNMTNQTFVDRSAQVANYGNGISVSGPATTVFSITRNTSELNAGWGGYFESFGVATLLSNVWESNGAGGVKIFIPAGTAWANNPTFRDQHIEANNGTYQLEIDADPSLPYGALYTVFDNMYLTAPVGAGNGKKYIHIGKAFRTEFKGGYLDGGDTTLTQAQKVVVDSGDSTTWFNNMGGEGAGGAQHARSIILADSYRVVGTGIGAGAATGFSAEMFSFDTGVVTSSAKKKFVIPPDSSGLMIVTEAAGGGASHRRAVIVYDANTGTVDLTEVSDPTNIVGIPGDYSGIEVTNVSGGDVQFSVTFIGRNARLIAMQ